MTQLLIEGGKEMGTGAGNAARLLGLLRLSGAIGRPPGLPPHRSPAEQAEIDLALFAIIPWLHSARPDDPAGEQGLLDLTTVLTGTHRPDVLGAMRDTELRGGQLARLSARI